MVWMLFCYELSFTWVINIFFRLAIVLQFNVWQRNQIDCNQINVVEWCRHLTIILIRWFIVHCVVSHLRICNHVRCMLSSNVKIKQATTLSTWNYKCIDRFAQSWHHNCFCMCIIGSQLFFHFSPCLWHWVRHVMQDNASMLFGSKLRIVSCFMFPSNGDMSCCVDSQMVMPIATDCHGTVCVFKYGLHMSF